MRSGPAAREAVKARYDLVLARERRHARAAALAIFPLEPFSAWEVMLLPLLVISAMRQKGRRDWFVKNYLFTKRIALEGALDLANHDRSTEEVERRAKEETDRVFTSEEAQVYGPAIQAAQLVEIRCLRDHDLRLLDARGDDYDALVRHAYRDRQEYETFFEALEEREREVTAQALEVLGSKGDRALVTRIHEVSHTIRQKEADRIFGTSEREGG